MEKRPRSILVLGWVVGVLYLLRVSLLIPAKLANQALSSTAEPVLSRMLGWVIMGVGVSSMALYLFTAILFFIWSYLAQQNARLLAPGAPFSHDPAVMVWSYFIPFVNLFLPYSAMREVFEASDAAARADDDDLSRSGAGGPLLLGWWLAHVVSRLLVTVMAALETLSPSFELDELTVQAPFRIVSGVLSFVWCVYLSRLQDRAIARQVSQTP
jgi:hypothetical protein